MRSAGTRIYLLLLASLVVGAVAGSSLAGRSAVAQVDVPRFEGAGCLFPVPPGEHVECGYLIVPEDRARPGSPLIRLAVAILRSTSGKPSPDPILFLEDGPGAGAVANAAQWLDSPLRRRRDVILLDPRGTGLSEPLLNCPELDELALDLLEQALTPEQEAEQRLASARTCRDRLRMNGVNLAAYTSQTNAADIADLRKTLGYAEWNLYGISYGSRLALTVLRDYPAGVRSAILDAAYPPAASGLLELVPNALRAFEAFFEGCASDAACSTAYPDLRATYYDLVAGLNQAPQVVPVRHPRTGRTINFLLTGDRLIETTFQALHESELIPYLPFLVHEIRAGRPELLANIGLNLALRVESMSEGVYYSIECHEELPFNAYEDLLAVAEQYPEFVSFVLGRAEYVICPIWGVVEAGGIETQAVTSPVPTLLLAGTYDPLAPPAWAYLTAQSLSTSYVYEFSGLGHGVSLVEGCPQRIMQAFLTDPFAAPHNADCIKSMPWPRFHVPERLGMMRAYPFQPAAPAVDHGHTCQTDATC